MKDRLSKKKTCALAAVIRLYYNITCAILRELTTALQRAHYEIVPLTEELPHAYNIIYINVIMTLHFMQYV